MNLFDTIRNTLVPIHKEGYIFIAAFFVASLVLGWIATPLFWIGMVLTAWCAYFFRDPERVTPQDDDLIISPADGTVSAIQTVVPPLELELGKEPMVRVSVFMNVFNCHVNRSPVRGRIVNVAYRPGLFLNADLDKASEDNERNGLVIETAHGRVGVVQIAGMVARRIVCWVKPNEPLMPASASALSALALASTSSCPKASHRAFPSDRRLLLAKPFLPNSARPRGRSQPPRLMIRRGATIDGRTSAAAEY